MNEKPRVLLVEDDADWLDIYCSQLKGDEYVLDTARTISRAYDLLQQSVYDAVVTDLKMLGFNDEFGGFSVLQKAKELSPDTQVVVITGYGTRDIALRATQMGAYDYVVKPPDWERFALSVRGAVRARRLLADKRSVPETHAEAAAEPVAKLAGETIVQGRAGIDGFIANSKGMRVVFEQMTRAMNEPASVLIWGEPGTGKDLVAKAIHSNSQRRDRPFSRIACSDVGGYWEVVHRNLPRIHGGTLLLDNMAVLNKEDQLTLYGMLPSIKMHQIRLVASANLKERDLQSIVLSDVIQEPLIKALAGIPIFIPPLRERKDSDDIPALIGHFIHLLTQHANPKPEITVAAEAMQLLMEYDYEKANVRELYDVIERAVNLIGSGGMILPEHLFFLGNAARSTATSNYDAFISYSHKDKSWVRDFLLPRLEGANLHICIDFRDFEPGVPSLINMENAVEQSRKSLIVLTPDWVESEWSNFESLLTQTDDPAARQGRMIPLLLKKCKPPKRIAMLTYVDFTHSDDLEAPLMRLIAAIKGQLRHSPVSD